MKKLKNNWTQNSIRVIGLLVITFLIHSWNNANNKTQVTVLHSADAQIAMYSTAVNFQKTPYWKLLNDPMKMQISHTVNTIFQKRNGHMWFGTQDSGIAYFDKEDLHYFSSENGLSSDHITGTIEDRNGHLWFSSLNGVFRYDGNKFEVFMSLEGLRQNPVWSIYEDRKGVIWAGSSMGLSRFDGTRFKPVPLPSSNVLSLTSQMTTQKITSILEDSNGNLWLGTDGLGVYKYDGVSFKNLTNKDGLCDQRITCIIEDKKGALWFGSKNGGLSMYNGTSFTNYNEGNSAIGNNEVAVIYEDLAGRIWFSSKGFGLYVFDGQSFSNLNKKNGLNIDSIQSIFQDENTGIWVGGKGGIYRSNAHLDYFYNITKETIKGC